MITKLFVEGYEVDLIQDIDVDFTFSIADIKDIEKRTTSFSKTITLPHTPTNAKLFGHLYDIAVENEYDPLLPNININFNPSKQAKAVLYVENVRVFDGVIRLINIVNKQGEINYEVNLFGKLKDILYALGDKLIEDIDFTDYNHNYNQTNVFDSWNRIEWVDGDDNYVYPLVDYGIGTTATNFKFENFKPSVFVREIIKRMFVDANFVFDAGFFDTAYFKKLLFIKGDKLTKSISNFLEVFRNTLSAFTIQQSGFIAFVGEVVNEGFSTNPAKDTFTSNFNSLKATLSFSADNISIINTDPNDLAQIDIVVTINGIVQPALQFYGFAPPNTSVNSGAVNLQTEVQINNGDIIKVGYEFKVDPTAPTPQPQQFSVIKPTLKVFNSLPQEYEIPYGSSINISETFPKQIKQRDFLKSIITMHNLFVEADPVQTNKLNFVPYPLYYETDIAQSLNWSNKIDTSQDIKIIPLGELTAREYKVRYDDDQDYWSQLYKTKNNETYGEYKRLVDNDFELETKDVKVLFGSPVMREEATGIKILHLYKVQNNIKQPDNFKPRIALWKRNVPCTTWQVTILGSPVTIGTTYPYAGHLDDPNTPTIDICFGTPKEVWFSIGSYPSANLGNTYYADFFNSITSKDSKLIQGFFYLNPIDIKNLEFNSLIKIGNHYFRLQKIEQYNPYANSLCLVTLLKVNAGLSSSAPFLLNEDGTYLLQENGINKFYI